jgi:predicted TIM-barrel fold metal-dependent hydrolase
MLGGLAVLGASGAVEAQAPSVRADLLRELRAIRAIDNHAHITRPVDGDTEYDALPFALLDPPPDGVVSAPWPNRNDYPWFVKAWQAIYGYPHADASAPHLKDAVALKQRAIAARGASYPVWILDKQGVEIALANRIAMGPELPASRFRWVPYADALLFPLDNSAQKAANRDYAAFYPAEEKLLQRYVKESGLETLPATLSDYCRSIVTATLERHKAGGAVAEKLEAAYLRWLDFGPAAESDAARVYAQYAKGGVPSAADYKVLQDYLFAHVAREAGRLGLTIHIHVANGGGANYDQRGANPLLLTWAFNEPSLRKTTFVVVHGGYPNYDSTLGLISKPNVYADFSALSYFEGVEGQAERLRPWLAQWPEKVLYGSDASPTSDEVSWEETGWVASQTAREALATALAGLVRDGTVTRTRASEIGRMVLRGNAERLYGLAVTPSGR